MREELLLHLSDFSVTDEAVLAQCASLCEAYNLTPEDLRFKIEALNYNRQSSARGEILALTMDSIAQLKADLQRGLARKSIKKPQFRATSTAMINRARLPPSMMKNTNVLPPEGAMPQIKVEQTPGIPSQPMMHSISFKGPGMDESSVKSRLHRYMYEKISDRSEALDDRIEEFAELVCQHYKVADLGDPSSSTDEEIIVLGRVAHDYDSQGAEKIMETTIALESSRMLAGGVRVPLRFEPNVKILCGPKGVGAVSFFPGAIVALKGKNGGGGKFLVTEILSLPSPKPLVDLHNSKSRWNAGDAPFKMVVACGPFTPDTDLKYELWYKFLEKVRAIEPTVLLLVGPFIDVQHPRIKNGDIDETPDQIFKSHFIDPLRNYLSSSAKCVVLVIPSVRDVTSSQAVFPQGELQLDYSDGHRIISLPNPSNFTINGVTFGVTSVDVLYHIKKEEYIKRGTEVDSVPPRSPLDTGNDVMSNLCRNILQQRSFYPIFPVPAEVSHEVNLSVTHLDGLKLGDEAPDVLIMPSRLKHFAKVVDTTKALNPGFLTKGTYAILNVGGDSSHGQEERITVDIAKIEAEEPMQF